MNQYIYIDWNLGSHIYTMTVNVSDSCRLLALNSLKGWLKFNRKRIQSWAFDNGSFVIDTDHYDTVKDLINSTLNK